MKLLAVDIGGTKIETAIIGMSGNIKKKSRIKTEAKKGKEKVIKNLVDSINRMKIESITKVGISLPGYTDNEGKILFGGGTLKFLKGVNLKSVIKKHTGLDAYIENDANCFALAEHFFGAGKGYKNMVGVIIGTGVGGGIIINNELVKGVGGSAGEFGHMIIDASSRIRCGCGNYGDFEALCSGPGIIKRFHKLGGENKIKSPDEVFKSESYAARRTKKQTIRYIAVGLANLANTLDTEAFILGGGVSNLSFYKDIRKEFKKYALDSKKNVKILKNKLGDSAGIIGAAVLPTLK